MAEALLPLEGKKVIGYRIDDCSREYYQLEDGTEVSADLPMAKVEIEYEILPDPQCKGD